MGPATAQADDDLFEQYEVVLGSAKRQTVLTGFLLGGAVADLAVVNIDENGDRHLRIYAFGDATWEPTLDAALRPEVLFVDLANIGGRDRLITYEPGRLNWFDPDSETEHALVEFAANYKAADQDGIPRVDISRDVNHDGRDDLVFPDLDGFWIWTQVGDGSFKDSVKLGPPEPFLDEIALHDKHSYGEVGITAQTLPWYLSRLHEMDYDRDGRSDLVFWNEDHFDVHIQDELGGFDPVAKTFAPRIPFDSDGAYSLIFGFSGESTFKLLSGFRKRSKQTVLHSFRDLNGDQFADLVTHTLEGRSVLKQRSLYEVHFGTPVPDGTEFARDASTAIRPQGRAGGLQPFGYSTLSLQDFDGDGQLDVMSGDVKLGLGRMIRVLLANSIAMDLYFFRCEDGLYPDKPQATRKIRPDFDRFGKPGPFFPAVLLGDVNGDGHADLLVGKSRKELQVFLGVSGPDLFTDQPQKVAVVLPDDERNTRLVDLDRDGKQDVLIHQRSDTEPHRVTMLMAR